MKTGTFVVREHGQDVWKAILDGSLIRAEFNSKGAAEAGISVERRRRKKRTIGTPITEIKTRFDEVAL